MASAPTIGAIETEYAGVRFRSRTEARWAVFFDALGLKWEHEPEAYTDGRTWYTPDFWLPELDCFWEVKGTRDYDLAKVAMLCKVTGKELVVSYQSPADAVSEAEERWRVWVDWWRRVDLSPEHRGALLENSEEVDGVIHFNSRFQSIVTEEDTFFRDSSLPSSMLQTCPEWIVEAAIVATRIRFWEPGTTRIQRIDALRAFERCAHSVPQVDAAFLDEVSKYEADWKAFCALPGEYTDLVNGPTLPIYPDDPRVLASCYNDRHDNLARKWFYELSPAHKRMIVSVSASKAVITAQVFLWALPDADWLSGGWETGDGDFFTVWVEAA